MAATELQDLARNKASDEEAAKKPNSGTKRGGWITFPFIIGTGAGLLLAGGGWISNLIVYLIGEFNMKSIDAAQVSNVVSGCACLLPVLGAIAADSFSGSFPVISVSSCISILGIFLLVLTATFKSLRPAPCEIGSILCIGPSGTQYAILYTAIALACIGMGGTRFVLATMGADQFDRPKDEEIFFNWFFVIFYASFVLSATGIVYIEDNMGFGWGFGLSLIFNIVGLIVFLFGKRFYRPAKARGSPFVDLGRVVVATVRKRKVPLSAKSEDYYYDNMDGMIVDKMVDVSPSKSLRFLNRAALKTEQDIQPDGSIPKTWRLCAVQQVEDFKTLIRIIPLWSTGIFLNTPIVILYSLTILQALTMDRHIGPHFKIPAGSVIVILYLTTSISLTLIDRFLIPTWQRLIGQHPTSLQRIGVGHVLNILGMVVSALVEAKRLKITPGPGFIVPISVIWLFPQLSLVGVGDAFHFPGQVALYYQEFPVSLKNTATAMISMLVGVAFYFSTALLDFVRRVTNWLPDDINNGRLDNVYWMLVVVGVLNFGYYIVTAKCYKYKNVSEKGSDNNVSQHG